MLSSYGTTLQPCGCHPRNSGQQQCHHGQCRSLASVASVGIARVDAGPVLDLIARIAHVVAIVAQVTRRAVPFCTDSTCFFFILGSFAGMKKKEMLSTRYS